MKLKLILSFFVVLVFQGASAQNSVPNKSVAAVSKEEATSPLKRADVISVKAALEEMIVRRYRQELSAIVSAERFNVGARFELSIVDENKRAAASANDNYTDLDLGYLDADTLFDRYANVDAGSVSPLAKYAIKSVAVNVGLQQNMGEAIKKSVEDWLQARVKEEFGSLGKSQVQFIQNESSNPTTLDRVIQMQGLVGQLILAIAILLGVVLWRLLSGGGSKAETSSSSVNIQSKTEMTAADGLMGGGKNSSDTRNTQDLAIENKIEQISIQVRDLAPKLVDQLDQLISQWCDQGEEGLMQIACFAEISGSVIGSLPIPQEHKKKMGDIFSQMSELSLDKRLDITNKTYWDLVASLNLGTDALHRPFSFLGNSSLGTVNQVLLGNDVDIQTVVSLYMPEAMRKNYFSKLENDKKIELLNAAAKLSTISQEKLKNIELKIAPYFEEKIDETDVSLSMTINKLIESMSILDSCRIMQKVQGPMVEEYKLKHAHIGFFADWTAASQEVLIKKSTNDELMAYVRVVPDMKPNVLELISPRAKQILEDDLSREDNSSDAEKEKQLQSLQNRLLNLVYTNVISLEDAIKKKEDSPAKGLSVAA
jgi:hypothetical protein